MTLKEGFINTIQISNIVRDNFSVINLCQRYPSFDLSKYDIPRGISASDKLLGDKKISILTTPQQNTLPISVNSTEGEHTVYQLKEYSPWIINLNEQLLEPIVVITFVDKNVECPALLDTGASVNCIGRHHFEMTQPHDTPDPSNVRCLGPDGTVIKCLGKINLTFALGTQLYREEFYILSHRTDPVCILSYPFMTKNSIRIVPNEYVTNCVSPSPMRVNHIPKKIGQLYVQPNKNCDIPPHCVSTLSLKLVGAPPDIQDHVFSEWAVNVPGQPVQVATLSHNKTLEIFVTNNTQMSTPVSSLDTTFARAIPYVEFLHDQSDHNVGRVSSSDIISGKRLLNADVNMAEDGISIRGHVAPEPIVPESNQDCIVTTGAEIPPDSIPVEPCDSCRSQGEKTYCKFDINCSNLDNPFISTVAPSKIEVIKEICYKSAVNTEFHTLQCIMDLFSRKRCNGCIIWCLSNNHPWFLPKNVVYPERGQLLFQTLSHRKAGVITKHYDDRESVMFSEEDLLFSQEINKLIDHHGISTLYLTCSCLSGLASREMLHARLIMCPGDTCPPQAHLYDATVGTATCQQFVASDKITQDAIILTPDTQDISTYQKIIEDNEALFSSHAWDIGLFCDPESKEPYIFEYKLRKNSVPYVAKFRPIAPTKVEAAKEMVSCLLRNDVITRRICPWVANSVFALKSRPILTKQQARERGIPWIGQVDESAPISLRLTVSYVRLNTCLEFIPTPLPNLRKLFREMKDSSMLTIIDLTWSYYSLKISDLSACLTGFYSGIPSDFTLCWTRTPMGISPSSGLLQAAVTYALSSVKSNVINYSDNILIHSAPEEHAEILAKTLSLLRTHGFKIKKNKMAVGITGKIKVLGCIYNVAERTLCPDPSKTKALSELPYPTSITKLKSFLGCYQFMVSSLHGCAQPLALLYKLTRGKGTDFHFDEISKQAFDKLIEIALHPCNFIYFINYDLSIIIRIDSSTDAVGYTLLQYIQERKRYVSCGYGVKVFTQIQSRYSPSERELLGAVIALKSCEDIIAGAHVIVQLDCKGIILLTITHQTNSKISRYLSYLTSFNPPLEFSWISGKDKLFTVADVLSRSVSDNDMHFLTNKKINLETEDCIEEIAHDFVPGKATIDEFPIILDYIVNKKKPTLQVPGHVFLNPHKDICVYKIVDGPCVSILSKYSPMPLQINIPLTGKELEKVCNQKDVGEHTFEDDFTISTISSTPFQNTLLSDLQNQSVSSTFESQLDITNISHRFLQFVITKFPLLNVGHLQNLQTKDTYFEPIIARCKETKNLIWVKKEGITFQMVKNILIRKYERPVLGPCFQLCIPKVVLTDQLIAMHRSIVKAHLGVKRLVMEFMEIFYNPHVHEYARMVIDNCFICAANRHRSKTTRPDFPNKILITVEQPGIFWYSDIIQIVSKKTSDMNSLLTFADGFSGFSIAIPFTDPMDNNKFITLFEQNVLTFFPQTKYILCDNAQNISSNVVKQALHNLNITLIHSRPYSSKSNIAEGIQRLLVRSIRLGSQEIGLDPHEWYRLVPPAVISLNATPYYGLKYNLCPHTVNLGTRPNLTSLFCLNPDVLQGGGYDAYVVRLARTKFVSTKIMCAYNRQKLKNNEKTQKGKMSTIQPGDIVFRHDRAGLKKVNYKLRPRSCELFLVLLTTKTSAYCRSYSGQNVGDELKTFQQFINCPKNGKTPLTTFSLQHFDLCDLIKTRSLIVCDTNSKFLASEMDKLEFPGTFSIEIDSPMCDSTPLNYDINFEECSEIAQEENIDILDPNFVKPIRSLLKAKKKVQFCPQVEWYNLEGNKQLKPLSNKYTIQYSALKPSFSSCI